MSNSRCYQMLCQNYFLQSAGDRGHDLSPLVHTVQFLFPHTMNQKGKKKKITPDDFCVSNRETQWICEASQAVLQAQSKGLIKDKVCQLSGRLSSLRLRKLLKTHIGKHLRRFRGFVSWVPNDTLKGRRTWRQNAGLTFHRRHPPAEEKAQYMRERKGNSIPNILPSGYLHHQEFILLVDL